MSYPLVSVGIPTYNRPEGLLNTIKKIVAQSYQNLEIIVSNNCSTNELVIPILNECARLDRRIKVFHQEENIGAARNFQFVLSQATGEYFMWAADDDDWDPKFIEVCLQEFRNHDVGTVMPGFYRFNTIGRSDANLPKMGGHDRFSDAMSFFDSYVHSIIYGLHKKNSIDYLVSQDSEVFDDELVLLKQILDFGVITIPEMILYGARVDTGGYKIKSPKESKDRYFYIYKKLLPIIVYLIENNKLTDYQKVFLIQKEIIRRLEVGLMFERDLRNPEQYNLMQVFYFLLKNFDLTFAPHYIDAIAKINDSLKNDLEEK